MATDLSPSSVLVVGVGSALGTVAAIVYLDRSTMSQTVLLRTVSLRPLSTHVRSFAPSSPNDRSLRARLNL